MDAKDLMIGDWVKFPIGIDKVVDLPYIEGRGICASFAASATLFPVEVDKLEPIPLTPEILEKNEFIKKTMYYVLKIDYDSELWYYPYLGTLRYYDKGSLLARFPNGMKYINELQHALRLCGIKKEIKL